MRSPFLERLELGPLLADGAMGTMLYAEGVDYRRCFDELNLSDPALVQSIHRRFITAGAELIETNTFAANRFKLGLHGLAEKVRDINLRGVKLAREVREVAGEPVFVAGAVGPSGLALRAGLARSPEEISAAFLEQIEALLEGGVDLLIFETFTDLDELRLAVGAARSACDLPIIAQMTFNEDERTLSGQDPAQVVPALEALGVDIIGTNCTIGPQGVLAIADRMAHRTHRAVSAMPNAGLPTVVEGRFLYLSTPQYFAEYARRFAESGVRIIGGCCGTTPLHIKAMKEALAAAAPAVRPAAARAVTAKVTEPPPAYDDAQAPTTETPTGLADKLAQGHYVISVELDPPKGINPAKVLAGAAMLKQVGADCINIGDSPMARVRMSCIAMAHLVQEQAGIEAIIHFTTRDRNLMAIQSELIGAHALGIRNVIALTGDPPRLGDYPNATGIWDVDSIGLISILKRLNEGRDYAGNALARPTSFFVACALTPQAPDRVKERERLRRKLDAGADLVMTQPLYTREEVEEALEYFGPIEVPILLGVLPVQSYRHAEFLHHEVPGIFVPDHIRERMRLAGERGLQEGLAITLEFVEEVRDLCAGVYIMPSFGRYEMAAEIIKLLRR
ncbi:MAG: bifunctional homocysteine S-methyltransferase/methylenetetrahydrofolate reductase [Chloroflexi bacterium]|nr:bifunctional homocysteine S-methyltransferase/methylenetetrahydrofolate reductase [Chloroflexota bacterium]